MYLWKDKKLKFEQVNTDQVNDELERSSDWSETSGRKRQYGEVAEDVEN